MGVEFTIPEPSDETFIFDPASNEFLSPVTAIDSTVVQVGDQKEKKSDVVIFQMPTPTPAPTPNSTLTPTLTPTPGQENCCEFGPGRCASATDLTFDSCIEIEVFTGFFPGHTCNLETGNYVALPNPTSTPTI